MADITQLHGGNVNDSGKVNWRGDQNSPPQGGQSIYDSSSVPLADLGSRLVAGDRVFRYAKAAGSIGAGDCAQAGAASVILATAGDTNAAGGKVFTWYSATAVAKNYWAEGYLICQSGTAANLGHLYRIKSHDAIGTTSDGTLNLYDPLKLAINVTDKYSIFQNKYIGLTENTAGTAISRGFAPIAVTSADYFWLQTFGPAAIKSSGVSAVGHALAAGATGQVEDQIIGTTAGPLQNRLAIAGQVMTASQFGLAFIEIAP